MSLFRTKFFFSLAVLLFCLAVAAAQQNENKTRNETEAAEDEVLKVSSALIQTGVTVVDGKGAFVEGLRQEDFELRVDGKSVALSFFEAVGAKKTAAKNKNAGKSSAEATSSRPETVERRGRNVIFVVDDVHLSFDSNKRTRDLILKFIDAQVEPDDNVAIVSPSGKIGFLQQFTSDKTVLREAAAKTSTSIR